MTLLKLITEVVPKKTEIIVTHPQSQIGEEILSQLKNYDFIDSVPVSTFDNLPQLENLGVIVHLAGFDSPSLSHTLSHTSLLHQLLILANKNRAKFVLVIPNSHTHLYHTALSLVTQFSKNHPIQYLVLEIDKSSSMAETASEIIKKFIYSHQKPAKIQTNKGFSHPQTFKTVQAFEFNLKKTFKVVGFLVVTPFLLFIAQICLSLLLFFCTVNQAESLSLKMAYSCTKTNTSLLKLLSVQSALLPGSSGISSFFGLPLLESLSLSSSLTDTFYLLNESLSSSRQLFSQIYYSEKPSSTITSGSLDALLSSSTESIALLQSQLKSYYLSSGRFLSLINSIGKFTTHTRNALSNLRIFTENLDKLIGVEDKINYLVLVQDNNELRPSGGYIDSLVLITLQNSKITQIQLTTSESADKQLVGSVQASSEFESVTGKSEWLLKDSNWDSDFSSSARRAAWFVQKELSFTPDVVVAVNLSYIQKLLETTGEIQLPESNLVLNSKNILSSYVEYLKNNPDSDSFVYKVLNQIIDKSKKFNKVQIDQFLIKTLSSLEIGEIYLYPVSFTSSLSSTSWGGGVSSLTCRSQFACLPEFFSIIDTNIGSNKSDYFIEKSLSVNTELSTKNIITSYLLQYKNSSLDNLWPAGNHKNYLRVLLPKDVQITAAELNNTPLSTSDYSISQLKDLQQLNLKIDTPYQSVSTLKVVTSKSHSLTNKFHFQVSFQNQPGAKPIPTQVNIVYPKNWFATSYSQTSVASPGSLQYNTQIDRPLTIEVDFSPND